MKRQTYHLRVFVKGREIHSATCPMESNLPMRGRAIRKKWAVQLVEPRLIDPGEMNLPPLDTTLPVIDEEAWFKMKAFVVMTSSKGTSRGES